MRAVIKIGTSTLAHATGCLNVKRFSELCRTIADIKNSGIEVILVSSGAIGLGVGKLHLPKKPSDIAGKQACAAVGQCELMYIYDREFALYNHTVAQMLLTAPDLNCNDRRAKFTDTLMYLLKLGILPIINENDTVATEEIVFGDNDTLAAEVAVAANADLLILLSDIDALYDKNPREFSDAMPIPTVEAVTEEIEALGGGTGSSLGTGGMHTKLHAAKIATSAGCEMIITNGEYPENLYKIFAGEPVGTKFLAGKEK